MAKDGQSVVIDYEPGDCIRPTSNAEWSWKNVARTFESTESESITRDESTAIVGRSAG